MRCQLAVKKPFKSIKTSMLTELKFDGVRLWIQNSDGDVTMTTRGGKQIMFPALHDHMLRQPNGTYDGELIYGQGKRSERTKISGLVNSSIHGSFIEDPEVAFVCFDYPMNSAIEDRREIVNNMEHSEVFKTSWQELLTPEEIQAKFHEVIADGYEGLMLKHPRSVYKQKRSSDWVKMKNTHFATLRCAEVHLGIGKYTGMVGSLLCVGKLEGKWTEVKVGTGLSDLDRARPPLHYIGEEIYIKYHEKTENSLFLPVFIKIVNPSFAV